jgi:hypothetical protein
MNKLLFIVCFTTLTLFAGAQLPSSLVNKWGFIGNGIMFFSENNSQAFVEIMEQGNYSFIDLYTTGKSLNKKYQDKIIVEDSTNGYKLLSQMRLYDTFENAVDTVRFLKEKNSSNTLYITGKSRINGKRSGIKSNNNCDTTNLKCPVYLYDLEKLNALKKLKQINTITKTDFVKFLTNLKTTLAKACNTCNDNFLSPLVNDIMIKMGYNPISTYKTHYNTFVYKTSAMYQLNFELLTKYKELKPQYEKIINNFYFNK